MINVLSTLSICFSQRSNIHLQEFPGGKQSIIVTSSSISVHYLMQCEFLLQFPQICRSTFENSKYFSCFLKVNPNFARKYFVCNKLSHQNNPLQFPSRIPMCFNPHFALNPQILQAIKKRKRFFHLNPVCYLTVLLKFCSVSFLVFTGWRDKFFFWWCHKCEPTFCTSPASQDQGPSTLLTLISLFLAKKRERVKKLRYGNKCNFFKFLCFSWYLQRVSEFWNIRFHVSPWTYAHKMYSWGKA